MRQLYRLIYVLVRWFVFLCWREPTRKEMQVIAKRYDFRIVMTSCLLYKDEHPLLGGLLIGTCDYGQRILWISEENPKVFWHELGHAISGPPKAGLIGWLAGEISATIQGYKLNWK